MARQVGLFVCCCALAALTGCALNPRSVQWPQSRAWGEDLPTYRPPEAPAAGAHALAAPEPEGPLTLREALAAAMLGNPSLSTFAWDVRVREAQALQASLLPNPTVEFEVEQIAGTDELSGVDAAESTLVFSQLIELGRKREHRTRVAELNQDLAAWDYEVARVAALADAATAFFEVLAMQERLMLAQENLQIAQEAQRVIQQRVEAGAVSPLDATKAKLLAARARIDVERATRALNATRLALAATWGSRRPRFENVVGEFEQISALPLLSDAAQLTAQNPQVARWAVEIAQRQAQVQLERSRAVPDMVAGVGAQHISESDDVAAVAQFSLPLPLFDRNQGGILEARYELIKAHRSKLAAEVRIATAIGQAYERLVAAHAAVGALEQEVLPAAQAAYEGVATAYNEGKVGYLDLLDAQRTLFETRDEYVEALASYHTTVVDLESLLGQPLSAMTSTSPQGSNEGAIR